ncbi:unnamed protein product [Closterium sp. NIES-54]
MDSAGVVRRAPSSSAARSHSPPRTSAALPRFSLRRLPFHPRARPLRHGTGVCTSIGALCCLLSLLALLLLLLIVLRSTLRLVSFAPSAASDTTQGDAHSSFLDGLDDCQDEFRQLFDEFRLREGMDGIDCSALLDSVAADDGVTRGGAPRATRAAGTAAGETRSHYERAAGEEEEEEEKPSVSAATAAAGSEGEERGSGSGSFSGSNLTAPSLPPLSAFVKSSFFHPMAFAGDSSRSSEGDSSIQAESTDSSSSSSLGGGNQAWGLCIAIAPTHCSCSLPSRPPIPPPSPQPVHPFPLPALRHLLPTHATAPTAAGSSSRSEQHSESSPTDPTTASNPSALLSPALDLLLSLDRHRAKGLLLERSMRAVAYSPGCRASMPASERKDEWRQQSSGKERAGEGDGAAEEGWDIGRNEAAKTDEGGGEGEEDGGDGGEGGDGEGDEEDGYRRVLTELSADFEVDLVQAPPALCSLARALPAAARQRLLGAYSPRFFPPHRTAHLWTVLSAASASGQQDGARKQGESQQQQWRQGLEEQQGVKEQQVQGLKEQRCVERVRAACMRQWWQREVQRTVQFVHAVRQCAASSPRHVLFLHAPHQRTRNTGTAARRGGAEGGGGGGGGVGGEGGVRVRERYDLAMERFVVRALKGRDWGVVSLVGQRPAPPPTAPDAQAGHAVQTGGTIDAGGTEEEGTAQAGATMGARGREAGETEQAGGASHEGGSASVLRGVRGVQALLLRGEASHLLPLLAHVEQRFLEGPLEDLLISFFGKSNKSVHVHKPPLFWREVGGGDGGEGREGAGEEEGGALGKKRVGVEEEGNMINRMDGASFESTQNWVQEGWVVEDPFLNEVKEPIRTALNPLAAPVGLYLSRSMLVSVHGREVVPAGAAGSVAMSGRVEGGGDRGEGDGGSRGERRGPSGTEDHDAAAAAGAAAGGIGSGSGVTRAAMVLSPGSFVCWVRSGGETARGDERQMQGGEAEAQGKGGAGGLRGGNAARGENDYSAAAAGDDYCDASSPSPSGVAAGAAEAPAGVTAKGVTIQGVIRGEVVLESPLTEQGAAVWTMVAPRAVEDKGGHQEGPQEGQQGEHEGRHKGDGAHVVVGHTETEGGAGGWKGAGHVGTEAVAREFVLERSLVGDIAVWETTVWATTETTWTSVWSSAT